jgi:hypothetical protein
LTAFPVFNKRGQFSSKSFPGFCFGVYAFLVFRRYITVIVFCGVAFVKISIGFVH